MALWRCPHCGTPQPVAARCWVCRRSATSCGTCRHFRESVAARIGYCGLDRERQPLAGDEIRGCWDGVALLEDAPPPATDVDAPEEVVIPGYVGGFVPVETAARAAVTRLRPADAPRRLRRAPAQAAALLPSVAAPSPAPSPSDGMLWSDLEG
jgi:hypothetical protein